MHSQPVLTLKLTLTRPDGHEVEIGVVRLDGSGARADDISGVVHACCYDALRAYYADAGIGSPAAQAADDTAAILGSTLRGVQCRVSRAAAALARARVAREDVPERPEVRMPYAPSRTLRRLRRPRDRQTTSIF